MTHIDSLLVTYRLRRWCDFRVRPVAVGIEVMHRHMSVDELHLVELMNRAVAGDRAAYEQVVGATLDPAYRLATLLSEDAGEAEDLVCDCFREAWLRIADYRFSCFAPRAWLLARLYVLRRPGAQQPRRILRTGEPEVPKRDQLGWPPTTRPHPSVGN